jgi:hypothetical protein
MELQPELDLHYDVDAVLRGQGADASILRERKPSLVKVAEEAMHESLSLLHPRVVYQDFPVQGMLHERLLLEGGMKLESKLIAQRLAGSSRLIVMLVTIGEELEQQVSQIWDADMVYALALDGAGSAAVEALANAACQYFEQRAAELGLQASIPLSPGMLDWPVSDGQPQIFQLLGEAGAVVQLTPGCIMVPKKSLTMVMGLGAHMQSLGKTCDYCNMRLTCKYQENQHSYRS